MAGEDDPDARTEAPTDKRRRESAERGEVLQSRDLGTFALIGAGTLWLALFGAGLAAGAAEALRTGLAGAGGAWSAGAVAAAGPLAGPLLALAGLAMAGGVAGSLATSARFNWSAAAPRPARVDPAAGLKRLASPAALVELAKSLAKFGLLAGAAWWVLAGALPGLLGLAAMDPAAAGARIGGLLGRLLGALCAALLIAAVIDLPVQWRRHMGRLRMTRQEVRDEARESEGSPETRSALRRAQRAAARTALRPALAEASVVLVNPASFAVALRYRPGADAAPVVVAKGREVIAAAIRDLAAQRGVPVLRYPQLARALYFSVRVGDAIREELYKPVATVLAFVLNLDRARAAPPEVEVPEALRFDAEGRRAPAGSTPPGRDR